VTSDILEKLRYELSSWEKNTTALEHDEMRKFRKRFILTFESIKEMDYNSLDNLIQQWPWEYFTLYLKP
jgi:hypothetical protein